MTDGCLQQFYALFYLIKYIDWKEIEVPISIVSFSSPSPQIYIYTYCMDLMYKDGLYAYIRHMYMECHIADNLDLVFISKISDKKNVWIKSLQVQLVSEWTISISGAHGSISGHRC